MAESKTYSIPQEVVDVSLKANAMSNLGHAYTKLPFGYKKAVKAFEGYQKLNNEFWQKVFKLYPELEGKALRLNAHGLYVFEDLS